MHPVRIRSACCTHNERDLHRSCRHIPEMSPDPEGLYPCILRAFDPLAAHITSAICIAVVRHIPEMSPDLEGLYLCILCAFDPLAAHIMSAICIAVAVIFRG